MGLAVFVVLLTFDAPIMHLRIPGIQRTTAENRLPQGVAVVPAPLSSFHVTTYGHVIRRGKYKCFMRK